MTERQKLFLLSTRVSNCTPGWTLRTIDINCLFALLNDSLYFHFILFPLHSKAPYSPFQFSVSTVPGSPSQLSALWSPPIPKNGIITAYTVYCNTSASQAYPEQMIGPNVATIRSLVSGTTLTAIITGLNPYTNYDCYVTANTSVGAGNSSVISTARTGGSGEL